MPSRRSVLAALGATVTVGSLAGCASTDSTTGTVSRKSLTVGVPRRDGDPLDASVAFLAFEPDRRLIHGEYDPTHAGAAVDRDGTLSVPRPIHDRLNDRFASVRYAVNVVPADGRPANGLVTREACNALTLGGTATVAPSLVDGVGHLDVRAATPPDRDPEAVTINQFDLDNRLGRK